MSVVHGHGMVGPNQLMRRVVVVCRGGEGCWAGRLGGGANDVIAKRTRSHVQIAVNTVGTLPLFREKILQTHKRGQVKWIFSFPPFLCFRIQRAQKILRVTPLLPARRKVARVSPTTKAMAMAVWYLQ